MAAQITFALIRGKNPQIAVSEDIEDVNTLELSSCGIGRIENLDLFTHVRVINLAHNSIISVENLEHFSLLEHLDLSYNKIDGAGLLVSVRGIPKGLQSLNITANPCTSDVEALEAFQSHFISLGIIIDVETVDGHEENALNGNKLDELGDLTNHTTGSRAALNNEEVLKEIVERKCKLQNTIVRFDLDRTLQVQSSSSFISVPQYRFVF
jgi:hypothetical protein